MVTNTAINGQLSVKARVFETKSNNLISDSRIESDGSFDLLSAPQFNVESNIWSEVRDCSDPYNLYSVVARVGEEDISISMSPGVVMKIKVTPITNSIFHCVGVLSIGTQISADFPGYLRVYPFNVKIPMGEEITILRKSCNQGIQNQRVHYSVPLSRLGKCDSDVSPKEGNMNDTMPELPIAYQDISERESLA